MVRARFWVYYNSPLYGPTEWGSSFTLEGSEARAREVCRLKVARAWVVDEETNRRVYVTYPTA